MQNKGAIKFFAIAFALVCLFQLSFTFITYRVEKKAESYAKSPIVDKQAAQLAKGDLTKLSFYKDSLIKARERYFLEDSMKNQIVFNFIWLKKYTYKECKEREINLGLDLKGGMNVTLEVSVVEMLKSMAGNMSTDPAFSKAISNAVKEHENSDKDFVSLFAKAYEEQPNTKGRLALIFKYALNTKIAINAPNEDVITAIRAETKDAFDRTFNILRQRIDKFGVAQPNIQKLKQSDRILIELPGVKDPERVRKLLQGTAQLEFWKTYDFSKIYANVIEADKRLAAINNDDKTSNATADSTKKSDSTATAAVKDTVSSKASKDSTKTDKAKSNKNKQTKEEYIKEHPLLSIMEINIDRKNNRIGSGPVVGMAPASEKATIISMLEKVRISNPDIFPRDVKFLWSAKPIQDKTDIYQLFAIRSKDNSPTGTPILSGDVITDARQDYEQSGGIEIAMAMNSQGASIWESATDEASKANPKECIAIVLDDMVYSAPTVNGKISGGHSSITGHFTIEEAKDLATVLKAGKLPTPAKIVEEEIVGPTLGKEAINSGLWSFIVAFVLTLLFMIFYYNRAGMVANVALFTNMFFVFGILASLQAVLTLPGIAGIVLTIGMDVDKNVIIYERIREEIRAGKGIRLAITDGYKHALTAIIDSNITTLLTGIVLYVFGSGPVQGFATTLIIGILSSLFCAIFITKLIFIWMMDKNKEITVWNKYTKDILTKVNFDFVGLRKKFYILSLALVVMGIVSLSIRGLSRGIDFLGGRSYVVRFDKNVNADDIRKDLGKIFDNNEPEVKTFGPSNQVKITTSYKIRETDQNYDSIVESKLYEGLKPYYNKAITKNDFIVHEANKLFGRLSSQKIEPTIAYDLLTKAYYAVFFSLLIIFGYIALRFRKWQWGVGGVVSLFHDSFIVISVFSLLHGVLPFSLDVGQDFIAAILTIIGYSIMDTVIIFDRIREYTNLYPKRDLQTNMNAAINSTLGRTLITSGITFTVLLAMFIFGGEVIRGFTFALLLGIAIGTYSSVFNATPIAYDLIMYKMRKQELNKKQINK